MDLLVLALIAGAVVAAFTIGLFFGSRPAAQMRAERDAREAEFKAAAAELGRAQIENARLQAEAGGAEARFADLANRILGESQKSFLERADQRFAQAGESNEAKLKALLNPVQETLKRYEEGLTRIEKEREGSYRALGEAVAQLTQGNAGVVRETQRLANVMRSSPKARGRWGEEQLKNILSQAGLAENVDFTLQTTVSDGERNLRPDCVVNLPGDGVHGVRVQTHGPFQPVRDSANSLGNGGKGGRHDFLYFGGGDEF